MRLKNKKIAFLITLPHHAKYLFPIAETVRKEGAEILFITSLDLYPFEGELLKKGYRFKFIPEFADEETARHIRSVSDKFCDEWMQLIFNWDGVRHWPFYVQSRLLMTRIEEYICLERMARIEKPDMFVALHEMNPWGKEIGHVAVKYGIPFVTLQEGDYYTDTLAFYVHTEYATVNLLWGETIVQHLEKYRCARDKMVVMGNFFLDDIIRKYSIASVRKAVNDELGIKHGDKVVAFLVGFDWAIVEKREIWEEFCKGLDRKGLVCIFKWHSMLPVGLYEKFEALMKEILPSAIMLYTYDPYKILAVSHYCVVLGRTTLAKEALAWQKPLFEVPRISASGSFESYYDKLGVAQLLEPLGNWEKLFDAMEHGFPEEIRKNADEYVRQCFYRLDGKALERVLDVISFILDVKAGPTLLTCRNSTPLNAVTGRVSFIIPSGSDTEALLASLTSLSEGVELPDWEAVIVVNDSKIKELLAGISGDLKVVESEGHNLSQLYNRGAGVSSGEFLVFILPGIAYIKGEGLVEAMKEGVAGMPIKNADMTPHCLGIGYDFNFTPYFMKEENAPGVGHEAGSAEQGTLNVYRDAVGGGLIGMGRRVFEEIGGFDEGIANHLTEADICLAAKDNGCAITYLPDCLGVVYKSEATEYWNDAERNGPDDKWKRKTKFFAKWCGKLPKDDDVIKFLGDLLKV